MAPFINESLFKTSHTDKWTILLRVMVTATQHLVMYFKKPNKNSVIFLECADVLFLLFVILNTHEKNNSLMSIFRRKKILNPPEHRPEIFTSVYLQ